MRSTPHITGTLLQYDDPDWGPLESLVGVELASWFMWMNSVLLEDDAIMHAYKHVATRRYIHMAVDGRTFAYMSSGCYCELPRHRAIALAFVGWESLLLESEDPELVRRELERALDAACDDDP